MSLLLGIDIGTSGTKAVLFDSSGKTISSASREYPLYQPQTGYAEQDPDDWWKATYESINEIVLKSAINPSSIKGIGLSGQMHGLVMIDKDGLPLRKAIIWCDQRTERECEEITAAVGAKRLIEITANPALTGFTAGKLLWVRNNEPELYEKCYKILLPKDYIRYKLTGEFATDVSDASGMQLLDVPNRIWSKEIFTKLSIDYSLTGTLYESCEITGEVNSAAADMCGLSPGTPIVGGAGDQAAAAVGTGITEPGKISSTIGTSGVIFAHVKTPIIDPLGRIHTFCHAVPGEWHVMGVTQAAGLSLKWYRDNFCMDLIEKANNESVDPYTLMENEAASSEIGSKGIIYLPYLMGERTPHLDPNCRGVFFGLSAIHTRGDLIRSVMEGVGFSLTDCLDIIAESGIKPVSVRASGGGGKSPLWRKMQADMFNCKVETIQSSEGGALGAAILAGTGAGIYRSVQEGCNELIKPAESVHPSVEAHNIYSSIHKQYRALYTSLYSRNSI